LSVEEYIYPTAEAVSPVFLQHHTLRVVVSPEVVKDGLYRIKLLSAAIVESELSTVHVSPPFVVLRSALEDSKPSIAKPVFLSRNLICITPVWPESENCTCQELPPSVVLKIDPGKPPIHPVRLSAIYTVI
jgi:hypothetical protein